MVSTVAPQGSSFTIWVVKLTGPAWGRIGAAGAVLGHVELVGGARCARPVRVVVGLVRPGTLVPPVAGLKPVGPYTTV